MTDKEIAERIDIAMGSTEYDGHGGVFQQLRALRDELDPPKPKLEPGEVVWWRPLPNLPKHNWEIAKVHLRGSGGLGIYNLRGDFIPLREIEWKLARILTPGQVAIDRDKIKRALGIGLLNPLMAGSLPQDVEDEFRDALKENT